MVKEKRLQVLRSEEENRVIDSIFFEGNFIGSGAFLEFDESDKRKKQGMGGYAKFCIVSGSTLSSRKTRTYSSRAEDYESLLSDLDKVTNYVLKDIKNKIRSYDREVASLKSELVNSL